MEGVWLRRDGVDVHFADESRPVECRTRQSVGAYNEEVLAIAIVFTIAFVRLRSEPVIDYTSVV
ncbi:MAG TPA: hypothetical protein VFG30_22485 [Polyangiales bacterium]|nr:hypothetical protein [Polyangiales bacterium]